MNFQHRGLWATGVVLGLGVAGYFLLREGDSDGATQAEAMEAAQAPTLPVHPSTKQEDSPTVPEETAQATSPQPQEIAKAPPDSGRTPIPNAVFTGTLLNEDGQPIEGARISWTHYPESFVAESSWRDLGPWSIDEAWHSEHTLWTDSDAQGAFAFSETPDSTGTNPSVIWVTHELYRALCLPMAVDPEGWANAVPHTLAASPGTLAHVVDATGALVAGATVVEQGLVANTHPLEQPAPLEDATRIFLRRTFETGSAGTVALAPVPGEMRVHAELDAVVSEAWTGVMRSDIQLRMYPSFSVGGRLTLDGGKHFDRDVSVGVDAWNGSAHREIDRVPMEDEGLTWGPTRIPLTGADRYSFRLESTTLVPRTQFILAPTAGERVTVDFESSVGNEVWFALAKPNGEYLENGMVELFWEGMDPHSSLSRRTRKDGYINILGCPTGVFSSARGSAPGYAPATVLGFEVPEVDPIVNVILLSPAGQISGHCLFEGQPVTDFEIVIWPKENLFKVIRKQVHGAKDGSFTVAEAPLGEVQILASADGFAPSAPQMLRITGGEPATVQLGLRTAIGGAGQVTDKAGRPLSIATIQLYFPDDRTLVATRGTPIPVDSEGRFELNELSPGRIGFKVTATGYSTLEHWTNIAPGPRADLGQIQLVPLTDLEVRVQIKSDQDPTQCTFVLHDPNRFVQTREQALSSTGTTLFKEVDTATLHAGLRLPDGSTASFKIPPYTGNAWIVTYEVGGTATVVLDVDLNSYDGQLPHALLASVQRYNEAHVPSGRVRRIPGTGEVLFEGVAPGQYIAKVGNTHTQTYGAVIISVNEGQTIHASITLDAQPTVLRIVDKRGDPVPGVSVSLYSSGYPLWRRAVSDAEGICTINGSAPMEAFAGLQHATLGNLWGVPVELAQGLDAVTEIEFAPRAELRLRLLDGATPLAGVSCILNAADNRRVLIGHALTSDAGGRVTFDSLGAATYGVDLAGPGIWSKEVSLEVQPGDAHHTIQLRRTGSARFDVTGATGQPLPGVSIELISNEFNLPVGDWVAVGRAQTSSSAMVTGDDGGLVVTGIPHGSYSWRVPGSMGQEPTGTLEVPVGGEALQLVRFR